MEATVKKSLGEYRVGTSFNPSNMTEVDEIKIKTAEIIDFLSEKMKSSDNGEVKRCFAEAMTQFETSAMWAVKALTKPTFN